MAEPLLRVRGLNAWYGESQALHGVDLDILPGETVTLSVVITDTTPRWEFYLLQKRDSPLADAAPQAAG